MKFAALFFSVTVPLYVLDQVTKFWVVGRFPEELGAEPITVIDNFFWLTRVHNQGVAWGVGNGSDWAPVVFLIVPFIALSLITLGWRKNFFHGVGGKIAAGLLLAGVLGNLTDRLIQGSRLAGKVGAPLWERLKAGYVVDFLAFQLPWFTFHDGTLSAAKYDFPVFNVADSCVCVAAALIFITGLKADLKEKKSAPAA
jgi:signal peptidase II